MSRDLLYYLYNTIPGRAVLKVLVNPAISKLGGSFLDSPVSVFLIKPFIKKNKIKMDEYEEIEYRSFNEFFCRKVKSGKREIDKSDNALIAPCDGLITCIKMNRKKIIPVKQSEYNLSALLRDKKLAEKYENGWCIVFRLCVDHYHRYIYPDSGMILSRRRIRGILHTVRPVALRSRPVFIENSREYMVLKTENFGNIIQMEVGAMLVGKIDNYDRKGRFLRGQEKGRFLYGGSTIILLLKDNVVDINKELIDAAKKGIEIPVKMGDVIGTKV